MEIHFLVASLLLAMPLVMALHENGQDSSHIDKLKIPEDDLEQPKGSKILQKKRDKIEEIKQFVVSLETAIKKRKDEIEKRREKLRKRREELEARRSNSNKTAIGLAEQVKTMHKSMIDRYQIHRCFKILALFGQWHLQTVNDILVIASLDFHTATSLEFDFNPRYLNKANSVLAEMRLGETQLDMDSAEELYNCLTHWANYKGFGDFVDWWSVANRKHPYGF